MQIACQSSQRMPIPKFLNFGNLESQRNEAPDIGAKVAGSVSQRGPRAHLENKMDYQKAIATSARRAPSPKPRTSYYEKVFELGLRRAPEAI